MAASAKARRLLPRLCQPRRPCSATPEVQVTLGRRGLGRPARRRVSARRHDTAASRWRSATAPYTSRPVVGAVAGEQGQPGHPPGPATARPGNHRRSRGGQLHGLDPAGVGVHAGAASARPDASSRRASPASHSPGPSSLSPVLSTGRCSRPPPVGRGRGTSSVPARRDRAMVGHGEFEPEQAEDRADPGPRSGAGRGGTPPAAQGRDDGEGRVPGLPAPGRARLGAPGPDRLVVGQTVMLPRWRRAASYSARMVTRCTLPRNAVAAGGAVAEQHSGVQGSWKGRLPTPPGFPKPAGPIRAPRSCQAMIPRYDVVAVTEGHTNGCVGASARRPGVVRDPRHARTLLARGPRRSPSDRSLSGRSAPGRRGAVAGHARTGEVRPPP